MHFLQLPTELHLEIASHLSRTCRAVLCLVNYSLRDIYVKPLYTQDSHAASLWAALHGNNETLKLAFKHGAVVNGTMAHNHECRCTLLGLATLYGHTSTAKLLLEQGADFESRNHQGQTPLHIAAQCGYSELVTLLLLHGADPNAIDIDGWSPLWAACFQGHLENVKALLANGADVELATAKGNSTPLRAACLKGSLDVVKLLLAHGANYTTSGYDGSLPFHTAAGQGHAHIVEYFIEEGMVTDLETKDNGGWTALNLAACAGSLEVTALLIKHGADVNTVNCHGTSPLLCVARGGDLAVAKFLAQNGADLTVVDNCGRTALIEAAEIGNVELVKMLIEEGAEVSPAKTHECSPLFKACSFGDLDVVQVLLDKGADAKERGCLHVACQNGHIDVVKFLLDLGVSAATVDRYDRSPIDSALSMGRDEIVKLLKDKGYAPTPFP